MILIVAASTACAVLAAVVWGLRWLGTRDGMPSLNHRRVTCPGLCGGCGWVNLRGEPAWLPKDGSQPDPNASRCLTCQGYGTVPVQG